MKQTAYESLLEVKHEFPKLLKSLKRYEQRKKKHEDEALHNGKHRLMVDTLNLILSIWKANPDIKVNSKGVELLFSGYLGGYPTRHESVYPDLSIVHDKDTRYYIAKHLPQHPGEKIFIPLQNFTKAELITFDNEMILDIFSYLLSADEIIPFLEWLFDNDTDRIKDIVPHIIGYSIARGGEIDPIADENFINAAFNEKYYNESYVMNHYSIIAKMLSHFDGELHIQSAFKARNPYLIRALFNTGIYSTIFDNWSHNGYTESQIKFLSVLYAYEVYNGGGRVSTRGSIPKYMRCKDRLGDLYQPLKSMLDSGYSFSQIYNRIKHRFADLF